MGAKKSLKWFFSNVPTIPCMLRGFSKNLFTQYKLIEIEIVSMSLRLLGALSDNSKCNDCEKHRQKDTEKAYSPAIIATHVIISFN